MTPSTPVPPNRPHYDMRAWVWLACAMVCGRALGAAEFFVAPDGADTNPGTKALPFGTLEAARAAARAAREHAETVRGGVTVWLRGGTYPRTQAFELATADSGSAEAPVVYRAMKGEEATLLGGRVVSAWRQVTDPSVLARWPEAARSNVLEASLADAGVTNFGQFRSRGFGRPTAPAHLELFFNGTPMTVARWPNAGEWSTLAGFPDASGQGDEHGGKLGKLDGGFLYSGVRPGAWKRTGDIWVHGYWAWDWANSYERVESLDPAQHFVRTAAPHGLYGFRKGQRFHFFNVLEELDQPGEYFVDTQAGRIFFWPPGPIGKAVVLASVLEAPLLSLQDVSHVTFRGLILEATRGNGIAIRGGASNLVAGCVIRLIGNNGVTIDGGQGHAVIGCDIENTGDCGVTVHGGDRQTLMPSRHVVENCHFQKQGRWSKCYVPAVLLGGVGQRVRHNLIHDHPHCAILYNGNDHLIELNEIHHVALETGDVGAIYTGRDWTYRGNRLRHNFIHHTGGIGMGSMGAYMDDCVSGTEIYGNIFLKVTRAAFLGGGRDHRVENNVFVECQPAVQVDGRGLDMSPVWHDMVYDYMRKQLAAVPGALYRRRYPALAAVERAYASITNGIPPEGNVVSHNVCVGGTWLQVGWHANESMLELRDNYVGPDPGFVDPDRMDFRLKKSSPVWALGFREIPVTEIGLREDGYRGSAGPEALAHR